MTDVAQARRRPERRRPGGDRRPAQGRAHRHRPRRRAGRRRVPARRRRGQRHPGRLQAVAEGGGARPQAHQPAQRPQADPRPQRARRGREVDREGRRRRRHRRRRADPDAARAWARWSACRRRSSPASWSATIMGIAQRAAVAYLVIGLADVAWQKYRHDKSLRMDKQEVKEEQKQQQLPAEVRMAHAPPPAVGRARPHDGRRPARPTSSSRTRRTSPSR